VNDEQQGECNVVDFIIQYLDIASMPLKSSVGDAGGGGFGGLASD